MEREFSTANMENLLRVQLVGIEELKEKYMDMVRRVVHAQDLAEEIDDQRLALEERIILLEDPLKMEEKLICSDVWAKTLQKMLVLTIENRTAETKKTEELMKEMEALKLENVKLKETISELTSFEESSLESDPIPRKRMRAPEYRNMFKLAAST
jgi:cell division protein FtsB